MSTMTRVFLLLATYVLTLPTGGVEGMETTKKKIFVEVTCRGIQWSEHYSRSCDLSNLTIVDLDDKPFVLNVSTLFANLEKFYEDKLQTDTCLSGNPGLGLDIYEMNRSSIKHLYKNGSMTESKSTCWESLIHLYDARVENTTVGCLVHPLGLNLKPCSAYLLKVSTTVDAVLQVTNDTISVISKTVRRSLSRNEEPSRCSIVPNFNDTEYDLQVSPDTCKSMRQFSPPIRCLDPDWNLYAWKKCSKLSFGQEVLHLDQRFDDVLFRNMTAFCQVDFVAMELCLRNNFTLCQSPDRGNHDYYKRLQKSYTEICTHADDFVEGLRCMEKIRSDGSPTSSYDREVAKCSPKDVDDGKDACRKYSKKVLCSAYAQYATNVSCTTFAVTYKYNRLTEDRNNATQNCTAAELDPCSIKEVNYKEVCSASMGCHGASMAVVLSSTVLVLLGWNLF